MGRGLGPAGATGPRGQRPPIANPVEAFLSSLRGTAEGIGEWAFYAAVVLIALALIRVFPYLWFYKCVSAWKIDPVVRGIGV